MEAARRLINGWDNPADHTAALAAMGLIVAEPLVQPVDLWPCHLEPLRLFSRAITQWQTGFAGPVGLRYEALLALFQIERIPRAQWSDLLDDIQVMEREALNVLASKQS